MALFKEYPKGGVSNFSVENMGEMHLPCVVLVDTSSSMSCSLEELKKGLDALGASINDDPLARGRVEICLVAFDSTARIIRPFGPAYDYEAPGIECSGMTAMHQAVDLGLSEIEARKKQYKATGTPYYRPWLFLLTDGGANDDDNGAFDRLIEAQKNSHCIFFSVGIGEQVDFNLLKSLHKDGIVLKADRETFAESFLWLSNSLSVTSDSVPDEKVTLPNPGEYQLSVLA